MNNDLELLAVAEFLSGKPGFEEITGKALRQSFDEVIDGARTGRYRIEQLEKTEKTYIGTKVEIVLRDELELDRGAVLDNNILGYEVDTKFSLSGGWMIPREAIDRICLLVTASDNTRSFSIGLLRMSLDVLTLGGNQDGKKSITASGKLQIHWLLRNSEMPRNFLLEVPDALRNRLLSPRSGKERIKMLFRLVTNQIIPRTAVLQVAQLKGDPLRRAREAKVPLAIEGYRVLCATYLAERAEMNRAGFLGLKDDDWVSLKP